MRKPQLLTRKFITVSVLAASALLTPAVVLAVQIYGGDRSLSEKPALGYHRSDWLKVQPKNSVILKWNCPANAYTVGGGFETRAESGNTSNGFTVIHSFPSNERQWTVQLRNQDDIARDVRIYNICAK